MGALLEKAKAEQSEDRRKKKEREEKAAAHQRELHEERAKPAAEWLSKWSGSEVSPADLQRADSFFPGFNGYATWLVTIDGFDLVVKQERRLKPMLDEHGADWRFELHQRLSGLVTRRISRPAELLDKAGVGVPA